MSMGFSGLFIGTKGDKTRRFNEMEERICLLSQEIGDLRLDICDSIDLNLEELTPYAERMFSVADYLEEARNNVLRALLLHDHAIADYIAEGYPGLDQYN